MAETFKLPCSSYEELIKLFQAYANALSAHISKKHRGMIEFVGQVRNAADHGADPDENNQVWTISNETARIYPCIIAALIKAIFSRDATGSIEV